MKIAAYFCIRPLVLTSNQRNSVTLTAAFFGSALIAAIFLYYGGSSDDSIRVALRVSARCAFLFFLLAFVARPLQQLYSTRVTRALLEHRRQFGIAFAGVHCAHLMLIIYRAQQIPDFNVELGRSHFGVIVYLLILFMLITSFDAPARALGPRNWKILHTTGVYAIGFALTQTLLPNSRAEASQPDYILFTLLIVSAVALRLVAFIRQRSAVTKPPQ